MNTEMLENTNIPSSHKENRPTIGFFNVDLGPEWSLWPWQGMVDASRKHDVNFLSFIGRALRWPQDFQEQTNTLYDLANGGRLDGLIIWKAGLVMALAESEIEDFCGQYGVPVVTLEGAVKGYPCVAYGNYQGMRMAVDHLIEVHGYQRIGFVGMLQHHGGFQERYRAYTEALAEHGLQVENIFARPWFPEDAILPPDGHIAEEVLWPWLREALAAGMEALVGVCDTSTLQALKLLQRQGIHVPHDVALVSFDAFTESRVITPPLTTVMPSWYELGYQALETLVDIMQGHPMPEQIMVPPRLMIRQSCGCGDPVVEQAVMGPVKRKTLASEEDIAFNQETMVSVMTQTVQASAAQDIEQGVARLVKSFIAEITGTGEATGRFIHELEGIILNVIMAGEEVSAWQDAISALRRQTLPGLGKGEAAERAEDVWQQARALLGTMAERGQAYRRFQAQQRAYQMREVGQALITTFDVGELMNVLAERLPGLGIPGCYLALYENPQPYKYPDPAPEWSRLILAYTDQGRISLEDGGQRFLSKRLLPDDLWFRHRQYSIVAEPLYFQYDQIGFVLFEVGTRADGVYETLRGQISSALQGALLMGKIARQKYVLDTFMANVPDSIYFKDCESRFTQANHSLAASFGIDDPVDLVGKTDFDFFPEEHARPKYEQEQEIIRTGEPILALEEADAGGRWALTSKMPLRDEHGEIIGTFGISRDITELKQAQSALEHAYSEISILNTQLTEENVRMSTELDVARRLQQMVLPPSEELQQIEGLDIVGYMQPADEVGGDYYDVLKENGIIHIGIGDVTGHGLESGVLMLMTQTAIRTLIEHGETDLRAFVNTLNRMIYKNIRRMQLDKTLTFAIINYQNGHIKIVGQHEEMLVIRRSGQLERVDTLNLGFPIGLEENIAKWIAETSLTLGPGDGIVLYTDGITEAENEHAELYGLERLCNVVNKHCCASAEEIRQAIIDDVTRHIGNQKVYDDLTLVVLKQRGDLPLTEGNEL